jgi:hypothetical protein
MDDAALDFYWLIYYAKHVGAPIPDRNRPLSIDTEFEGIHIPT